MTAEEKEDHEFEEYDEDGECQVEVISIPRWFMDLSIRQPRPEADCRSGI